MKKLILLSLLVLLVSGLAASSRFAGLFTTFNNSAADLAFGNESGTANIWNTSPLSVWSNPAKLGYHNGFAWGFSDDQWLEEYFDNMYHTSSYISVGWKGIGIMLPMLSRQSKFGTVMDYGEQVETDEDGNETNSFDSYESSTKYAIGVNLLQFSSNFLRQDDLEFLQYYGELSIGYNYNKIAVNIYSSGNTEGNPESKAISHSSGLGMIARISPFNKHNAQDKIYKLDLTAGVYYLNPEKTVISFGNEEQSDPLYWGTNTALSGKLSLNLSTFQELKQTIINDFTKNFFSVYYSRDNTHYGEKSNPSSWCSGVEFSLCDIFSYRIGQSDSSAGRDTDSSGFGINLNYKETFQFQYNVSYAEGSFQNEETKADFLVRVDFLKAYEMMR